MRKKAKESEEKTAKSGAKDDTKDTSADKEKNKFKDLQAAYVHEGVNILLEASSRKRTFEVRDNLSHRPRPIATLHDLPGAAVELHHPFRVEQHVALLGRLVLQAHAVRDGRSGALREIAHERTP